MKVVRPYAPNFLKSWSEQEGGGGGLVHYLRGARTHILCISSMS